MKPLFVICIFVGLSTSVAFARGGMSSHMSSSHMSSSGGALGTSAAAPGTNSLGTALSSSGIGSRMKGPPLGTSPALERDKAKVDKAIGSICRGC